MSFQLIKIFEELLIKCGKITGIAVEEENTKIPV